MFEVKLLQRAEVNLLLEVGREHLSSKQIFSPYEMSTLQPYVDCLSDLISSLQFHGESNQPELLGDLKFITKI
jgi:hypothetical protein